MLSARPSPPWPMIHTPQRDSTEAGITGLGVGGELRGDQDRLVSLRAAAQPSGQCGPREPDLPGFGRVGSGVTAGARRRGCRGHSPAPFGRIYFSQPVA